ncbi:MAG: Glu/Leu/Phe/Val dehydrogenase dimerization domain-containing protein [Bacteroidia bacterium]
MEVFSDLAALGHQAVLWGIDERIGLRCIIAVHDTTLGPALGGVRFWPYGSEKEALRDVLRLSRGMTYKASISGLHLGGGKAVIIGNPHQLRSEALFRRFGQFVDMLGGKYITAEDVGVTVRDIEYIRAETKYVTGLPEEIGGSGDPSPVTAYGVYLGMKAAWKKLTGVDSLHGRKILVQGMGKVGKALVELLAKEGAQLWVSDLSPAVVESLSKDFPVQYVSPDAVYDQAVDIFAPCALGGILNAQTIPRLRCAVVAGSANNQLLDEEKDSLLLKERGILFAPDFLINAGGLINVYTEIEGYNRKRALSRTEYIYEATLRVFEVADKNNSTPYQAAMEIARQRVHQIAQIKTHL